MDSKFVIFMFCAIFMLGTWVRGEIKSKDKPSQVTCASAGIPGIPGVPGNPGRDGLPGSPGSAGAKGDSGRPGKTGNVELVKSTWKQCVWKRADNKDTGLIQSCTFNKKYDNTSLRVFYEGSLRPYGSYVCNRWYFTFNLMAQNVQNQRLLKELFTSVRVKSTPIVTAILKATVTRFLKVMYVWGSGLASVRVKISEMVTLVGIPCPVL